MKIDLEDLERTARAASQNGWRLGESQLWIEDDDESVIAIVEPTVRDADMQHIGANSPQVTLALIRRIRELWALARRGVEAMRDLDAELVLQKGGEPRDLSAEIALLEKGAVLP